MRPTGASQDIVSGGIPCSKAWLCADIAREATIKATLHIAEDERLAALRRYDILDTPREAEFDDVVRVLSAICNAPICVINLIDEGRQWFKAEVGLGVRETPLDTSICAHAILQPGLFIVPDTREDARFSDNPLVTGEPHLRFYAGALLETADGYPLGTVCLLDYEPRELDEDQRELLKLMAKQVMRQLELRRALRLERNARLRAELLASDNELLAREVDHRVKNSLQLVSSILGLQARAAGAETRAQLEAAQRRVMAVASVHEQLYRAGQPHEVKIDRLFESLCAALQATAPDTVLGVDVEAETATLSSELSITTGLILAELVTNAFKHAYPSGSSGRVAVSFRREGSGWRLAVFDRGVGLPEGFNAAVSKGLGMRVLTTLVSRLRGRLEAHTQAGLTTFAVTFPAA